MCNDGGKLQNNLQDEKGEKDEGKGKDKQEAAVTV